MKPKVFCVGMFKTGTKSFGAAMNILGYKGLYRPWFILGDNWNKQPETWPKHFDRIRRRAEDYDAFSDAPWMFLYKQVDKWFPGSKFVLTMRKDTAALVKSDRWQWRNKPANITPTYEQFAKRYEENNGRVINYFKGRNDLLIMCFEKGDGFPKLCKFLGVPVPNKPFPHMNKSRHKK